MRSPMKRMLLGLLFQIMIWAPVQAGPLAPPAEEPPAQVLYVQPPPPLLPPPSETPPGPVVAAPEEFPQYFLQSRWKLLGGAGIDLVGPFQENNRAFTVFIANGKGGNGSTQSTGFGDPFTVASHFWLGFAGPEGWGFRVSTWNFSQAQRQTAALAGSAPDDSVLFSASPLGLGISSGTALLAPGNADVLTAVSHLNVHVVDFELTREIEAGNMFLVLSTGARLARLSQRYDADITNTDNDFSHNAEVDQLRSGQRFVGAGPTLALQAWYPLGWAGLSLYGTVRGSYLFGDFHQFANTSSIQAVGGSVTETLGQSATFCHNAAVPVGELEIGIQWSGEWGRFHPFLRTGVQAQTWFNALSGATVQEVNGDSANLNSNLSFFGVTFQAGVNY